MQILKLAPGDLLLLKKPHPFSVQAAGAGKDVPGIGTRSGEGGGNDMAHIVKPSPVDHTVIARSHPAHRQKLVAVCAKLCRQGGTADTGDGLTGTPERIKLTV